MTAATTINDTSNLRAAVCVAACTIQPPTTPGRWRWNPFVTKPLAKR